MFGATSMLHVRGKYWQAFSACPKRCIDGVSIFGVPQLSGGNERPRAPLLQYWCSFDCIDISMMMATKGVCHATQQNL
jgi:hypothetical protein